ncbi:MAG: type 1 glutamine amidotransferase [Thermodesulfobacteriota bacterium]
MKIHFFQHVQFEGPGSISSWAEKMGHRISTTRLFAGDSFPPLGEIDWLFIMGGPMGAGDDLAYPWLLKEKKYIEKTILSGKPIIGICLGAQILAHVLGARVYPNRFKEIGWFPVRFTTEGLAMSHFQGMPEKINVFQWHGDTFDMPDGAILTATGEVCENQSFLFGKTVFAFQFHLEATEQSAAALIKHCGHEIIEAPYIQSAGRILEKKSDFTVSNGYMDSFLDRFSSLNPIHEKR